jgi:protein O-GlcNAc transferase
LATTIATDNALQHGLAALQAGKLTEAERCFKAVLGRQPNHIAALNLLGVTLTQLAKFDEAEKYLREALEVDASSDVTLYNYGIVLKALKRPGEAFDRFSQALAVNSNVPETWNNRGTVLNDLLRYQEAIKDFDRAVQINPRYAEAFCNKGKSLAALERFDEAISAFGSALALRPALAEAWLGRGNMHAERKRYGDALADYDKALSLKPDLAEAWHYRGSVLFDLKQYKDALADYDRALAIKPKLNYTPGARLLSKLYVCDWKNLEAETADFLTGIRERDLFSSPFTVLPLARSPVEQSLCAAGFVRARLARMPHRQSRTHPHDRIRVAYLSADFQENVVAYLIAGLLERHDRSRFEITGISLGSGASSPMRFRLQRAFERLIDVGGRGDGEVAELIADLEIDIAVDLMGYTENARPGIFARRPAPVQVSYLGFLGTTGAEYIDYVIADQIALPFDQQAYYTEKIVNLPDCFLVNDNALELAPRVPSREEAGLPIQGFVFCSFNNSYKLGREMFEIWMRLLRAVDGSVLWLAEWNAEMVFNLRSEAERCGVDGKRLIFAPRVPLPEHLARQRLAGLFLDTIPYNAGATGAAALWAGLPVLTIIGETFVGRMAASVLNAIGLPELVAHSLAEYEALALTIATDPAFCAALKEKLSRNRDTYPLFDTARSTRNVEAAYRIMWQAHQSGEPPRPFAVESSKKSAFPSS